MAFRPITLTPSTLTLEVGQTATIRATGGPVKSWTSSDSAVAAVSLSGLVRGVSRGAAVITAKGGPYVAYAQVTVTARDILPPEILPVPAPRPPGPVALARLPPVPPGRVVLL